MSIDYYLFYIDAGQSIEDALARMNELQARIANGSGPPDHHLPVVDAIIAFDNRFSLTEHFFCDLLAENSVSDVDRQRFQYFALNGPDDLRLAQIHFHSNHITIHCYSGTEEDDLDGYFRIICDETDYSVFDPQSQQIYRYSAP